MKASPFLNHFVLLLIKSIRPFLGPAACRFSVSCTQYASIQLEEECFVTACLKITKRVLRCNPLF